MFFWMGKRKLNRLIEELSMMGELKNIEIKRLIIERNELNRQVSCLNGAIEWAMGARGTFRERGAAEGPYWWREELRRRANLWRKGGDQIGGNREEAARPQEGEAREGMLK